AAWVAPAPGPRVRAGREFILDARHALHEVTGRPSDRLVLQEQDEVARVLGLADADTLMRRLAEAGRVVAYVLDQSFRQAQRSTAGGAGRPGRLGRAAAAGARLGLPAGGPARRGLPPVNPHRRPLADGLVEQDGEVVLALSADPAGDPALPLRAAAAAARSGLTLAPRALARPAGCPPLPVPPPARPPGAPAHGTPCSRCSAPARRRSASGRRWTRPDSSLACCRTGRRCATARSATRFTPSPWTGTWSRRRRKPPRSPGPWPGRICF